MSLFELIMIAIGLSMDAFAVSVTNGMLKKKFSLKYSVTMAGMFGLFQMAMPIIGYYAGVLFKELIQSIDHWIAFVLLMFIGGKMIYEAIWGKKEEDSSPVTGKMLVVMAIATSIDALAVGVSLAVLSVNIITSSLLIGIITFGICFFGAWIGSSFGKLFKNAPEIVGGLILMGIGTKILIEHLFFQ